MNKQKGGRPSAMVATTFFGLEQVLAQELTQLGAVDVRPTRFAVHFRGDTALLYRANLWLRTAIRVLCPLERFEISNAEDLYRRVVAIDWSRYMSVDGTLAVDSVASSKLLPHTAFPALKVKDGVVDMFRKKYGRRPSVNVDDPDLRIHIHIRDTTCTLSLDSSGRSLHRRGYRLDATKAPLNEIVAAGMVLMSGWKGDRPLVDGMCGGGTIPVEAALIAANCAPGVLREDFALTRWPDFNATLWQQLRAQARSAQRDPGLVVWGSDVDKHSIHSARENARRAGVQQIVSLVTQPFDQLEPPPAPGVVVLNPPYGERMNPGDLQGLYTMIGNRFKHQFAGYEAWVISSNSEQLKYIGLKPSQKIKLHNGGLECSYRKYELYQGRR
jgi:putative N6-adenine-specific DNA methylase